MDGVSLIRYEMNLDNMEPAATEQINIVTPAAASGSASLPGRGGAIFVFLGTPVGPTSIGLASKSKPNLLAALIFFAVSFFPI